MMRRSLILAAVAVIAGSSSVAAQSIDQERKYPPAYTYDDDGERAGPQVYGYYRSDTEPDMTTRAYRPSNCGQYRYWNGDYCADARVSPPNLE